ncbi:hypothetical protein K1719_005773 [Acacia pycnantha]|nr:hypothetical protein K1719_005773 [Acacia pycnantha]
MGDSEEQGVSGTQTGMQLQGGSSSSSPTREGGMVIGGGSSSSSPTREGGMVIGGGSLSSSPTTEGGMVIGGGSPRVNKEIALPLLMALKESLEAQLKQVKSLINMVSGEEILAEEVDRLAHQQEIMRKALADEQEKSLELQMQLELMKLILSGGPSSGTSSS